jgi:hypothetical protein
MTNLIKMNFSRDSILLTALMTGDVSLIEVARTVPPLSRPKAREGLADRAKSQRKADNDWWRDAVAEATGFNEEIPF